ncbi:hypothetical protein PGT21_000461 [Puccinia graminis f. sp. tritici]|uniref:Uncharacterized protein n=1 Tax=Puccinia graminis f. sp. tritici TaxID=56615 RepID=A0A5B0P3K8_PUCGR|nr:hypothetical protein PGT21_000396 [Puccinia graminis f. sp. tritici]KAA1095536.1 hypothetical protein PGT21_000461 [Puccinia graminis f. sp. tritici]
MSLLTAKAAGSQFLTCLWIRTGSLLVSVQFSVGQANVPSGPLGIATKVCTEP